MREMRVPRLTKKRTVCALVSAAVFFVMADRLPAPVQEIPESATPSVVEKPSSATEQPAQAKKAHRNGVESATKAKSTPKPTPPVARRKFAGQWRGTLNGAANG